MFSNYTTSNHNSVARVECQRLIQFYGFAARAAVNFSINASR